MQKATSAAEERFREAAPLLVRAPGRVNLIGEHTDYNDGYVLPMAIELSTWVAARARRDDIVVLHSLEYGESAQFSLNDLRPGGANGWISYAHGVAGALKERGHALRGFEGVICTDIPLGAGLSSSAALELGVARVFAAVSSIEWNAVSMARVCQLAEDQWVGVHCGIMDQLISACGITGKALLVDCRDLAYRPVPLPAGVSVIVLDTGKRRGLVDSDYNERREQCAAAAAVCKVTALRDVMPGTLAAANLDDVTHRRARHVIAENARTIEAADAMERSDAVRLGELMNESHESLKLDFEVSCRELDLMVGLARVQPGCLGARMTGAGFGGCAIALVESAEVENFVAAVSPQYQRSIGLEPSVFVSLPAQGTELVWGGVSRVEGQIGHARGSKLS